MKVILTPKNASASTAHQMYTNVDNVLAKGARLYIQIRGARGRKPQKLDLKRSDYHAIEISEE
jgi:hypothetical protein